MTNNMKIGGFAALLTSVLVASTARSQSFVDHFDDNDLTDGSPVTWDISDPQGQIEVMGGEMVLTSFGGGCCIGPSTVFVHDDVVAEMTARFINDTSIFVGISVRETLDGVSGGYWAGVQSDGELGMGYVFPDGDITITQRGTFLPTGRITAGTEIDIRVAAIGNTIRLDAWKTGLDPLTGASIEWTDPDGLFPSGNLLIPYFDPYGSSASVAITSFGAQSVPEPSCLPLTTMAAILSFIFHRRVDDRKRQ